MRSGVLVKATHSKLALPEPIPFQPRVHWSDGLAGAGLAGVLLLLLAGLAAPCW